MRWIIFDSLGNITESSLAFKSIYWPSMIARNIFNKIKRQTIWGELSQMNSGEVFLTTKNMKNTAFVPVSMSSTEPSLMLPEIIQSRTCRNEDPISMNSVD